MRRREILTSSGMVAILYSRPTFAQGRLPVVAVLVSNTADQARDRIDAIRKGLQEAEAVMTDRNKRQNLSNRLPTTASR